MNDIKLENILIAVSDKSSIDGLLPILAKYGVNIWATEGTANYINSKGYKATSIVSGFDFDGRVKSLDKLILARILADRNKPSHLEELKKLAQYSSSEPFDETQGKLRESGSSRQAPHQMVRGQTRTITPPSSHPELVSGSADLFDAVIVGLYKLDEANFPESMDIGGVTLIRAAIKNYQNVALAFDQSSIEGFTEHLKTNDGSVQLEFRKEQAKKASRFIAQRCNLEAEMFEST